MEKHEALLKKKDEGNLLPQDEEALLEFEQQDRLWKDGPYGRYYCSGHVDRPTRSQLFGEEATKAEEEGPNFAMNKWVI